jgi:predicted nucleic-acid-binding protein
MRAVDTNVLVRLLLQDHPGQFARTMTMLRNSTVCATPTVILETEWVLRSVYRLRSAEILEALRSLLQIAELHVESQGEISQALDWFEQGIDFADALHLATARHCDGLATFDRDFIKAAARIGLQTVAEP